MKRSLVHLTTFVLIVGLLAGCGSSAPAKDQKTETPAATGSSEVTGGEGKEEAKANDEPVNFTFWSNDGSPQWMNVWNGAVEHYKAVKPNVTIETFGIPWDTAVAKFNTAAATNTLPDMAFLAATLTQSMLAAGVLRDLDPLFEKYEGKDNINAGHLNFYRNMNPKNKGLWTAPMFGSTNQIWYRADWFKEAGIEWPKTWDEWFETCKTMTKDGHYGYSFRGGPGGWFISDMFLMAYTNTSDWFADYKTTGKSFFAKPETLDALKKYIGLVTGGYVPPTAISNGYTEMIAEFSSGNAAMAWHHLQSTQLVLENLTEDQVGYGEFPLNKDGVRFIPDEPQGIGLFNACPDEKVDEAFEFIKFLWTPEEQISIVSKAGGVPSNITTDAGDNKYLNAALKTLADDAVNVPMLPMYLKDLQQFHEKFVVPDIQAMMLGEANPEDVLKKWDAEAVRMYEEFLAE